MDQYNEFIYMKDFGAPMYSLIFALENNNIKYMEYREFQSQIHIESNLVTSIEDNKRYYTAYISGISDSPFTKNMISANVPLYTYLENGKEEALPLFFNYDNCKQCGDLFEISINVDNRDVSFYLEKNKIAIYFPANKSITIYQIDDLNESEKNFRKPIETYQFTKKGFYCSNIKEKQYSCVYDETEMGKLRSSVFSDNSDTATLSGIRVYRQTPLFRQTNNIFIYIDSTLCNINIPLSINFATNMYQSDALNENFVADERNRAINRVVDMEKDAYHPVIWDSKNENYVTGIDKEADKIVFNLHFRQHRGDDWLVEPDTYWNGCYVDETDNKVKFINEVTEYNEIDFFSYKENKDRQSDLLTYLNFTNDDVRYQKNKLARSFIRIMFYDSMNPANQNLLYYSTVFLDVGTLFGKYIKHIEEIPYRTVIYETDETTGKETINAEESVKDLVGIKVNREPCGDLTENKSDDEIEELRLSCQLSIQDKYQSNGSSDGFYLYLWKDNEIGVTPVDLYVKVEFNHAGYGRTIPMMMPFWDENKHKDKKGIKTFQEILDDWNSEKDENDIWKNNGEVTDGQYGARQYMKYSYIHFKCKYDKIHKQHIYYLDDEYYGTNIKDGGVHFEDNIITLNLYEAKMV